MKNIILSVFFTSLFLAGFTEAATVYNKDGTKLNLYGRIEAKIGNEWTSDQSTAANLTGRLGIDAQQKLDDTFTAIGKMEWQVNTQANDTETSDDTWKIRYAYAGVQTTEYGRVMVGRTRNPMYQWMGITDRYMNFTPNVYSNWVGTRIDSSYQWNRQDGTIQYEYLGHNVDLRTAYLMGNGAGDSTVEDGYMSSLGYTFKTTLFDKALTIKPVVAWQKLTKNPENRTLSGNYTHYIQEGLGLRVNYDKTYLGATVGRQKYERINAVERKFDALDTLAEYWFTKKIALRGGYSQLIEKANDDYAHRKQWLVEAEYKLQKDIHLSTTYIRDERDDYESPDNLWVVGLRYEF
ncbi:porin [Sodalis sp. RH21]|uniref:porin n=1 Tax=unclassified Sodalis (in: enterobacteria) TaxID=2636512 RepID=UPI0039B5A0A6